MVRHRHDLSVSACSMQHKKLRANTVRSNTFLGAKRRYRRIEQACLHALQKGRVASPQSGLDPLASSINRLFLPSVSLSSSNSEPGYMSWPSSSQLRRVSLVYVPRSSDRSFRFFV